MTLQAYIEKVPQEDFNEQLQDIQALVSFIKKGQITDVRDVQPFYLKWMEIAKRLKTGESFVNASNEDEVGMTSRALYTFLIEVLGVYGELLRHLNDTQGLNDLYDKMERQILGAVR